MMRASKVLGEPNRLEIFRPISAQEEPLRVCHIVAQMPLQRPTISLHLRQLREVGLVTVSRRVTWAYNAVARQRAGAAHDLLGDVLARAMKALGWTDTGVVLSGCIDMYRDSAKRGFRNSETILFDNLRETVREKYAERGTAVQM